MKKCGAQGLSVSTQKRAAFSEGVRGNRRFLPHLSERSEREFPPAGVGFQRKPLDQKKDQSSDWSLFSGAEDGTRTHTPKVLASKTRASTIPPLPPVIPALCTAGQQASTL